MQGKAATLPDLAGRLGLATAKALVRLWERLREIASFMRQEYGSAYRAARWQSQTAGEQRTRPIRTFAWFLVAFQAIALIFIRTGEGVLNPLTFGILVALLWSFPAVWCHIPRLLQKLLLLILVTILEATFFPYSPYLPSGNWRQF